MEAGKHGERGSPQGVKREEEGIRIGRQSIKNDQPRVLMGENLR